MYDAWAAYDDVAETLFLGKEFNGNVNDFAGIDTEAIVDIAAAREEAISFAAYRMLLHRFRFSPGKFVLEFEANQKLVQLGYDFRKIDTDYTTGDPAALGNYIAEQIIQYGLEDNANESNDYTNQYYQPSNESLIVRFPGNPRVVEGNTPPFLSPEWGKVKPFALSEEDLVINTDSLGNEYWVYHDPGVPPKIGIGDATQTEQYQWGNSLVSIWSSHMDPTDGVMWDISPASLGRIDVLPENFADYPDFYDYLEGGDPSTGHVVNPFTGLPYNQNIVPRGDYARVLAEFWADGPESETPPGHWYTLLNTVSDDPRFEKKYKGIGEVKDDLEWDVKAYLTMGGAMHDCAISAWGVKGWYDYIRPVSAIRYMASLGQCTDSTAIGYHQFGIPIVPGYIETVEELDPLAGEQSQNVGKIKVMAWRGPDYINNPETDVAGVDWILADNWWPYQRPSFVTPNFAGYVSGHSTFSRAAAEVMTMLTGDEFFPGGMGEFVAPKDDFLVFEKGPSEEVVLQWATYRDASDQTSLSRIWGGIHPPADDIPGRLMGIDIGFNAFQKADDLFNDQISSTAETTALENSLLLTPNLISAGQQINVSWDASLAKVNVIRVFDLNGALRAIEKNITGNTALIESDNLSSGNHIVVLKTDIGRVTQKLIVIE